MDDPETEATGSDAKPDTPAPTKPESPSPPSTSGAGLDAAAVIIGGATPSNYDPTKPPTSPKLPADGLIPDGEWEYYQEHKNDPGGYEPPSDPITTDTGHYDDGHGLPPAYLPPPPGHDIDDGSYTPPEPPPPGATTPPAEIDTSVVMPPTDAGPPPLDDFFGSDPTPPSDSDPLPPGVNKPKPHLKWNETGDGMSDMYKEDVAIYLGSAILPESDLPPDPLDALEPPPLGWDGHRPPDPIDDEVASSDDGSGIGKVVVGGILAVLAVAVVVVVVLLSGSDDGSDVATEDDPTTEADTEAEATLDTAATDDGMITDASAPDDGAVAVEAPISYTSTCNGSQCNLYDAAACTFTYQLQVTFDFPDGASHEGEIATVATVGPGWEPTYEFPVVSGGIDTTLTASHCLASGESASWRAVVTDVGGKPTITPDPPA